MKTEHYSGRSPEAGCGLMVLTGLALVIIFALITLAKIWGLW